MGKCKHKALGKYECPNDTWVNEDKCMLHRGTPGLHDEGKKQFNEDLINYIKSCSTEIVFDQVCFPQNTPIQIQFPNDKPITFNACKFYNTTSFCKGQTIKSLQIVNSCSVHSGLFNISDLLIQDAFEMKDFIVNEGIVLTNITLECKPHLHIASGNLININIIDFSKGISLDCDRLGRELRINHTTFNEYSHIQVIGATDSIIVQDTKFEDRTDFVLPTYIKDKCEFSNCCIDNLFLRNFEFNNPNTSIKLPYLLHSTSKTIRQFKSLKKDETIRNAFIKYTRNAKDYFKNQTEFQEIYDHFYRLDLYFSRSKKGISRQHKIVNWLHWAFSDYGYSIIRPIICFFGLLFIFNFLYLYFDYKMYCHEGKNLLIAFYDTLVHHIGQIAFFRTADDWYPIGHFKRILLVLEYLLLIPIATSIVISIKKVFRRT